MDDSEVFFNVAGSLRVYRRAELKDYAQNSDDMLESVYVDPLEGNIILKTVLMPNTTFLYGRKGTGKSTIFAKAQRKIRQEKKNLSIYLDVKTLYDQVQQMVPTASITTGTDIDEGAMKSHLYRKLFLTQTIKELIGELNKALESLGFFRNLMRRGAKFQKAIDNLTALSGNISDNLLVETELPVLRVISNSKKLTTSNKMEDSSKFGFSLAQNATASAKLEMEQKFSEQILNDDQLAQDYASVLLKSFPFSEILNGIGEILEETKLNRLYIFLDDFSEINFLDQRLFVDVVLTPLNNTSNERVKLKLATYPGRVYFGGIDPSKIDHVQLDFYNLYKSERLPEIEESATAYTQRLLTARFNYYGLTFEQFMSKPEEADQIYKSLFEASFNIPRVLGYLLHYLHADIAKGKLITRAGIRLAALKYFEQILEPYFQANAYALEPYSTKLDRYNQKRLLELIIGRMRAVRRGIITGKHRSSLFTGLNNPPTSHFTIATGFESVLSSLEFNQFMTKFHEMRDKDGNEVSVFALNVGLCEREEIEWGYPRSRRYDKDYFKQRVFSANALISNFLNTTQAIVCSNCGKSYALDMRKSIEDFGWLCQQCGQKTCELRTLNSEFGDIFRKVESSLSLDPIELDILQILHEEKKAMRAGEISALLDTTYQLVGKRTEKLKDMSFVDKQKDSEDSNRSTITAEGEKTYFTNPNWKIQPRDSDLEDDSDPS